MSPLATIVDLQKRLGATLTGPELQQGIAALDDLSATARTIGHSTWIDHTDTPATVRAVVLHAAGRLMRNPDGFTGETAGDCSYRLPDNDTGAFTWGEQQLIRRTAGRAKLWGQPFTRMECAA